MGQRLASFEALTLYLAAQRRDPLAGTGRFADDHPIVIVPTGQTTWEHAVATFNACVLAEYSSVSLASSKS